MAVSTRVIGGLIVLGCLLIAGHWLWVENATRYFALQLKGVNVATTIRYDSNTYTVIGGIVTYEGTEVLGRKRGEILRLAYQKTAAERSPIFALAGTDPAALRMAIRELEKSTEALADVQKNQQDATLVRTSLYPMAFLSALANLEEARMLFLTSTNVDTAHTYEKSLFETFAKHRTDISRFRHAFQEVIAGEPRTYASATKLISKQGILSALDSLQSSAHMQQKKARQRSWCFRGFVLMCNPADLSLPLLPLKREPPTSSLKNARRVVHILEKAGRSIDATPIVQLSTSYCIEGEKALPLFARWEEKDGSGSPGFPLFVGDIYLLPTEKYIDTPFFKQYFDKGIGFTPSAPFTYYTCLEMAHDLGAIFATLAIRQQAIDSPLSTLAEKEAREELRTLEKALASNALVREADAARYISAAQLILADTSTSSAQYASAASLMLSLKNRSAEFDRTVSHVARTELHNAAFLTSGIATELEIEYLFFVRNAFPALFLSHNLSAGEHPPLFESKLLSPDTEPYVYYSEMPEHSAAETSLLRDLRLYYQERTTMP